ncbi:MAG: LPS export ABC transporter periplasmic protein LptC [Rhodospirillaceae bacterium]|nr:MAG: LPS export ABC transporter periplasmic protein LptC [Rhodospirillaceae bacterium]
MTNPPRPLGPAKSSPLSKGQDAMNSGPMASNLVGGSYASRKEPAQRSPQSNLRAGGTYSRFVSTSKVLLPFLALSLVALVVIWPRLNSDQTFSLGFSSAQLAGKTQPGMDNARYVGTDENSQPYSVTADLARIVSEATGEVDLQLPKADLTMDDGTWLVLTADTGRYIGDNGTLELEGGVNLFHDTGYEISTEHLIVFLKTGMAEGHKPISGHGPFGEVKAQGLKLVDKGRLMYFTGPAQLILYTPKNGGSAK